LASSSPGQLVFSLILPTGCIVIAVVTLFDYLAGTIRCRASMIVLSGTGSGTVDLESAKFALLVQKSL
jgi:hypothetical protein